jgi:geranylgeranyl reductase family protein
VTLPSPQTDDHAVRRADTLVRQTSPTPASPQRYDIAVTGAGPAGCSAALALAHHGLSVILLDKAPFPRDKTCGGGLVKRACQLLPVTAAPVVERTFDSVALTLAGTDLRFLASRTEPILQTVTRSALDAHLAHTALGAGVHVTPESPVRHVEAQRDFVEIDAGPAGRFRVQFLIAADGATSSTARLAGWWPPCHLAPALECEVYPEEGDWQRLNAVARFDFGFPTHGYGWVFPKRTHLSIGLLSMRRGSVNLKAALHDYLCFLSLGRVRRMDVRGGLLPVVPRPEPLARGRVLLAGDAAGLVDPVTGEGISHALLSGRLAAQAVLDGALDPAQVARRYQASLEDQLLPELRAGRLLARLLYHHPRIREWVFRRSGQGLVEFMTDLITGQRSYRQALRRPSTCLKALTGPSPPHPRLFA